MSNVAVRPASIEDASLILEMLKELAAFQKMADVFYATLDDVLRDGFGDTPRYEVIIGEVDGHPLGLAVIFPTYSTFKAKPSLFVDSLFVSQEARGSNLGKALMADVCRSAIKRDCCRVELCVLEWNPARKFYEHIGMEWNGELPHSISGDAMFILGG
jgi:GNAT superfamily N-acetyltransferase